MKAEDILCPRDYIVKHYMSWLELVQENSWKIESAIWLNLLFLSESEIREFVRGEFITVDIARILAHIFPPIAAKEWLYMQYYYQLAQLEKKVEN